jgi:hypothetical protein
MEAKDIIARIKKDINNGDIKVMSNDGYRYYTDVLTETIQVPITTPEETAKLYEKLVINPANAQTMNTGFTDLPRVSMFVGQPDTGKTYMAFELAKQHKIEPILIMCRDNLNLETLLEDFKLIDGKPAYTESLAIKALSGTDNAIIILDEFNTLLTGVMKTFQPIFDTTSPTFEYKGKIYTKNLNCKFFVTLNDKDKGISVIPNAILSRSKLRWFPPVELPTLARWTGLDIKWITIVHSLYKILGLLDIFGSRQLKMIHGDTVENIKNHLIGLCNVRNVDAKAVDTLQVQQLINQL